MEAGHSFWRAPNIVLIKSTFQNEVASGLQHYTFVINEICQVLESYVKYRVDCIFGIAGPDDYDVNFIKHDKNKPKHGWMRQK